MKNPLLGSAVRAFIRGRKASTLVWGGAPEPPAPDLDRETPQVASSNLTQLKTRRRSNTQPAYDEIT